MKYLIIDDNFSWVETLSEVFKRNPNVQVVMAFSALDALQSIEEFQPDVVFLDHRLSSDGNEGFEVVKKTIGVKFYSTTASREVVEEYERMGIEVIGTDIRRMEEIIRKDK
jgi:chemotaxis response regulator CheB